MTAKEAAEQLLGCRVDDIQPLSSGVYAVTSADRRFMIKRSQGVAESAGLRWLSEHGDVAVPRVHGSDDEWLVTDFVVTGPPTFEAADAFGRGLAALHLRGADAFGAAPPGGPAEATIGLAPLRNDPCDDWPTFYLRHGIEPYVKTCVDQGLLTFQQANVFDLAGAALPELCGSAEQPARLHGDLWNGNLLWGMGGQVWLIDPAAHGGHRETDLAMLRLFGAPLLDHILGAYAEAAENAGTPLQADWQGRTDVHQLFPLLVHAALFGGGYMAEAFSSAQRVLAL
ncbi:Fructosamine-3-kinase [Amycolatopsis xylanica]|uniref:Fructosamine-3-kinase n=1 Tax=Amycolatopsis xylanica TaxID=589385 RepID=A0A1H3SJD8_9PSEU|nr:fructosamine kinase family protein [Amycolatopsis xylanica]SDZ38082.1 Fructosamine-3-kinase [Amycolatopsis xylanica]